MRPCDGVLILEGKTTADGRRVREGALTWRTPVPIFDPERKRILGHAYGVTRHGSEIRAVGSVDLPAGDYAVAAEIVVEASEHYRDVETVVDGRLVAVALVADGALASFPDARLFVRRDHIDAQVAATLRAAAADAYPVSRPDDSEEDEE